MAEIMVFPTYEEAKVHRERMKAQGLKARVRPRSSQWQVVVRAKGEAMPDGGGGESLSSRMGEETGFVPSGRAKDAGFATMTAAPRGEEAVLREEHESYEGRGAPSPVQVQLKLREPDTSALKGKVPDVSMLRGGVPDTSLLTRMSYLRDKPEY